MWDFIVWNINNLKWKTQFFKLFYLELFYRKYFSSRFCILKAKLLHLYNIFLDILNHLYREYL